MRRREFIRLLGGAAALWPRATAAQQPSPMPVIGFLSGRTAQQAQFLLAPFRAGLKESGYVEGQNVAIEYRFADNRNELLPGLAAELVGRRVSVIVAGGTSRPAVDATKSIPIVFTTGFDPVASGLVNSLNKPEANVTGATFYSGALGGKQLELLAELVPRTRTIGLLVNPILTGVASQVQIVQAATASIGREFQLLKTTTERDFDEAFATLAKRPNPGLIVSIDPLFDSHREQLVALAERYALPSVYGLREYPEAGGLVSYGASITDAYRQAGAYAGLILKGKQPSDLPVQLPVRFELVVNAKTAKALGLPLPPTLLARADEVIE